MENSKEIHDRMLKNISDKYDKTKGSFFYDSTKPAAIEFERKNKEIKEVADKLDVENLEGYELERFIYQRIGIQRKQATKATITVTIVGQEGAKISKGDLVGADTVNFISLDDKTIDNTGQMIVNVQCEEFGSIGNVPVGAIKYFPISIAGLTSVINAEPVKNGYDAESDKSLIDRYYERIRTPATSGNKYHYQNWAKEVTGVGDARVFPLWQGDNTVKVIIIDSNKQPAGKELIDKVQEYIDPQITGLGEGQAPIGAFCTVVSAISKDINISVVVTRDENYSLEQIKLKVEENIRDYLKSIAFKEDIVSYAKIGAIILNCDGVLDYTNLKINNNTSNINVKDEEIASLNEVVISE
ncbi:baseplate J/gp47 family protein [Tissierella sp.]|uniref:baseplate J/gp47 family protein n=1 Tax=Tissierella sp. TaxID=41274 RepID=UPI0028A91976|nr:baseplate J/gp47 family protein [Tissierella sp.]